MTFLLPSPGPFLELSPHPSSSSPPLERHKIKFWLNLIFLPQWKYFRCTKVAYLNIESFYLSWGEGGGWGRTAIDEGDGKGGKGKRDTKWDAIDGEEIGQWRHPLRATTSGLRTENDLFFEEWIIILYKLVLESYVPSFSASQFITEIEERPLG